jgi:hypothetical protein
MLSTPAFGLVTRADDVREVLADDEHFGVPAYNERMTEISGPFILGLGDTDLYRHDHQALRAAIRAEDLPEIAERTLGAGAHRAMRRHGRRRARSRGSDDRRGDERVLWHPRPRRRRPVALGTGHL